MKEYYAYVIIEKETGRCCQTIKSPVWSWSVNNATHYSMPVDLETVNQYLDKYFYDNAWWERVWSSVDEDGNPVEGATYTDYKWEAKLVEGRTPPL